MGYALRAFGSYFVSGHVHEVRGRAVAEIAVTAQTSYAYDPNGHYAVEAAYVQFFVPEPRRQGPPVVLVHGGGMSGAMWETTPDGRPGWLHGLLARGHEVHVIDNVERGRAGWVPGRWEGAPILRTMEEAWSLFRFGPPEGFAARRPYAGCRFPVAHLESFARQFVPRWTSTTKPQVAALVALLSRLGRANVIAHSQGAAIAATAVAAAPERVATLVTLEPSGFTPPDPTAPAPPTYIVCGDYLECDALWRGLSAGWRDLAATNAAVTLIPLADTFPGTSHMPMMDLDSVGSLEIVASLIEPADC
ncbi:MAG: alpha/beta fold hydrolase [Rhodobacteraceae bacterium]|nr:alpha/beta fold hydrolase [Paracoccaceae bacterium]